jgi:hypothetical protein
VSITAAEETSFLTSTLERLSLANNNNTQINNRTCRTGDAPRPRPLITLTTEDDESGVLIISNPMDLVHQAKSKSKVLLNHLSVPEEDLREQAPATLTLPAAIGRK